MGVRIGYIFVGLNFMHGDLWFVFTNFYHAGESHCIIMLSDFKSQLPVSVTRLLINVIREGYEKARGKGKSSKHLDFESTCVTLDSSLTESASLDRKVSSS